jgi:hypothetical protein
MTSAAECPGFKAACFAAVRTSRVLATGMTAEQAAENPVQLNRAADAWAMRIRAARQ